MEDVEKQSLKEKHFNDVVVPNLDFLMEKLGDAKSLAEIRILRKLYVDFIKTHAEILEVSMVELENMYLHTLIYK